jgi:DNA-binding LytR/AlgR family response regulator
MKHKAHDQREVYMVASRESETKFAAAHGEGRTSLSTQRASELRATLDPPRRFVRCRRRHFRG